MRGRSQGAALGLALLLGLAAAGLMSPGAPARSAPPSPDSTTEQTTATPPVSVYPIVGSQVAPPHAQLVFRGVDPLALSQIQVSGSLSGDHSGEVEGDSDGQGGSFIPDQPFSPGEIVTVTTPFTLVGAPSGAYQFRVAESPGPIPPRRAQVVPRRPGDVVRLLSRPDLEPPAVRLLRRASGGGGPELFLAPQFGPVQNGVMILDPRGGLVWFRPTPSGETAADFQTQRYQGQPVLTWWEGHTDAGVGIGEDYIYDRSYSPVATVRAADGLSADLHEFLLTASGTALITAYYPVWWDARAVGGPRRQIVLDCVVQEIDVPTGLLLMQWDSLDHVPLQSSYRRPPARGRGRGTANPYDYFHINSVQSRPDGNLLISARNTWAAYLVRRSDGLPLWTLGGKRSSFRMAPGASFAMQHDVRLGDDGRTLTMFDDGAGPPVVHGQSRGLTLLLDGRRRVARLLSERRHSPPLLAYYQGNFQTLPGGSSLIGWGELPYFTEFDRAGRVSLDGRFVSNTSTYRAYEQPWSGAPGGRPAVRALRGRGDLTALVSWNGDTRTAYWLVFAQRRSGALVSVRAVPRRGFETAVRMPLAAYVRVQALDGRGGLLASSFRVPVR